MHTISTSQKYEVQAEKFEIQNSLAFFKGRCLASPHCDKYILAFYLLSSHITSIKKISVWLLAHMFLKKIKKKVFAASISKKTVWAELLRTFFTW